MLLNPFLSGATYSSQFRSLRLGSGVWYGKGNTSGRRESQIIEEYQSVIVTKEGYGFRGMRFTDWPVVISIPCKFRRITKSQKIPSKKRKGHLRSCFVLFFSFYWVQRNMISGKRTTKTWRARTLKRSISNEWERKREIVLFPLIVLLS